MGSYSQVVVGIMLLVVAFFFGRYINQQPIAKNETAERPELIGTFESTTARQTKPESVALPQDEQKTLRDRILSQRKSQNEIANRPPQTESTINDDNIKQNQSHREIASTNNIVEPDFSHLRINAFEKPLQTPNLPNDIKTNALQANTPPTNESHPGNRIQPAANVADRASRFSINWPDQDLRNKVQPTKDYHEGPMVSRNLNHRSNDSVVGNFKSQREMTKRRKLVPDNPRYRMVPVRERVGKWNPEPVDYVSYTTVFGDSLHSLSTKFYGSSERYLDIYLANQELFESPSEVPVNTEIRIPVMK